MNDRGVDEEFTFRRPRENEVDALAELQNACAVHDIGIPTTSREDFLRWWHTFGCDLSRDVWVVEREGGGFVGAGVVSFDGRDGDLLVDGYTHPEYRGRGIGSRLADLAEARAVQMATEHGRSMPVEVLQGAWTGSEESRFLEARRYAWMRSFLRMRAQMDEPPAGPVWPDGIELAGFTRGRDEAIFHACLDEGFRDHWRWTHTPLDEFVKLNIENDEDFDGSLWFRAMDGDRVVGAIVCVPRTSEEPGAGWIEDLAVLRPWRGRGIGLALLLHGLGALYRRGLQAALLAVDAESPTGATRLYERAGMREIRRMDVYSKLLG